ncbi:MAG: o-succinylbenzoate synthase [Vicinamibacteria bacterium]
MRIERVEVRQMALPMSQGFETSFGRTTVKEFLLVAVSADGLTGYGECVADPHPYYLPETNGTVQHVLRDFLIPRVLGEEDVADPRAVAALFAPVRGHEMAKAALEMAVWDLEARRQGVPLYALLGGRPGRIAAGVSIGLQAGPEALVDAVAREVDAGYQRIKVKIKPGHDRELVAAVRKSFPALPLMVDANNAYTLADAPLFGELDRAALTMIEQPLAWDDLVDHAALQRTLGTPLCLDESIRSAAHARHALDLGACRIVNVKVGRLGGFTEALALHDHCRARGVPLWCGGMVESGIGRLANVHLQTLPGFTLPGDTSAGARYFAEDLVDPPVTVSKDGWVDVPDGPGIGHQVVEARVERATRQREVFSR